MLKKFLMLTVLVVFALGIAAQAGAATTTVTIDLVSLFDTNNSGHLTFGDDGSNLDYKEKTSVTKTFTLTEIPDYNYDVVIAVDYTGYDPSSVDSDTYITINGTNLSDFADKENNHQEWTYDVNNLIPWTAQTITIHLANYESWLYDHYEDFAITNWTLSYQTWAPDPAPVPVPSAGILLGLGLAGLTGIRRRRSLEG